MRPAQRQARRQRGRSILRALEILEDRTAPSISNFVPLHSSTVLVPQLAPLSADPSLLRILPAAANPGGSAVGIGAGDPSVVGSGPSRRLDHAPSPTAINPLVTVTLKALNINLLGLQIQSDPITVTITPTQGDGKLLGNVLTTVSSLLNVQEANTALNNVLAATVDLLNSVSLQVSGVGPESFSVVQASTTPILNVQVAPIHLDLLGAQIDTSPVHLTITVHSGPGLVLGNVLTELTNLLNPPLPSTLDVGFLTNRLGDLLARLDAQVPGIPPANVAPMVQGRLQAPDPNTPTLATAGLDGGPTTELVVTPDHALWSHQDAGAWSMIGSPGSILSVSAVAEDSGLVVAFAVTTDHTLVRFDSQNGWKALGVPSNARTVSAGTDTTGRAAAFVLTTDGALQEYRVSSGGVPTILGNPGTIMQLSAGRQDRVSVVTVDGTVAEYNGASGWLRRTAAGFASQVSAVTDSQGNLAVFAVARDGSWFRHDDGIGWRSLGAPATVAALSAGLDTAGHAEVFLLGTDGSPLELSNSGWRRLGGAGSVSALAGANAGHAALLSSDGSVLESFAEAGLAALTSANFVSSPAASSASATARQVLSLTVPPLNLNLLGLVVKTTAITVDATAQSGDGALLGNVLTALLNTLNATPEQMSRLNDSLNRLLAKVIGILNASTLTLPPGAVSSLSQALQTSALPNLLTPAAGASAPILDLIIASPDGTTPPVKVNLLGLGVTTSNIDAQLVAQTGDGQVLGNLLYNVANLLNPGGPATLIGLLRDLALPSTPATGLPATGSGSTPVNTPTPLLTLTLPSLNLNLLGLQVQSSPITVTVSDQEGNGKLLGNLVTGLTTLINTQGVSKALNQVLATTVNLLNSVSLQVPAVGNGTFTTAAAATTPVLDLSVAPVHLDLLGVLVDTSPIHLTITAHAGDGLVLGNVLTDLATLFNPPLPAQLDLAFINNRLAILLTELNQQLPGIPSAPVPPTNLVPGQVLGLTVPPLDLHLLGLMLKTSAITVNATAQTGNGALLGNLLQTVLNTIHATPEELNQLNANLNALLAKVVGVLNVATLTLPANVLSSLPTVLQTLALPNLIAPTGGASAPILDLVIAAQNGNTPPVIVDLLGVHVTTSDINALLSAQAGDGLILGNLLFNVANLLNPNGSAALLFLLTELGQ